MSQAGPEPKAMWIQAHTDFRDLDDSDNFYLISSAQLSSDLPSLCHHTQGHSAPCPCPW